MVKYTNFLVKENFYLLEKPIAGYGNHKMKIYKPPFNIRTKELDQSLFLAGSIEMGKAVDWQKQMEDELKDADGIILNPRRDDWDNSWGQTKEDKNFREQVEWELYGLENCSLIAMFFEPGTKSPISLLELGLHIKSGRVIICCPDGFQKKGNVDVTAAFYRIPIIETFDEFVKSIKQIVT